MLTYVSVGWIIRSFYTNTIDQEMAYEVIDGRIAMDLIKPVSIQWMWISAIDGRVGFPPDSADAADRARRLFYFPDARTGFARAFYIFLASVLGSFFLMGAIGFLIGTCAIPLKSILALVRAKQWLIELLSGLLLPMSFFPDSIRKVMAWLPFEHIAYTPLQIYLGNLDHAQALQALGIQWLWVVVLLVLAHLWWNRCLGSMSIHGG